MKSKIKIAFYSHVIDFAGTWRSHERIAEVLQHDSSYEVYVFYSDNVEHNRLEISKNILNKCKFVKFYRTVKKNGSDTGYAPIDTNISDIAKEHKIDVFHFARSGYYEWPFTSRMCPIQIETNIFGYVDNSDFLDGSIVISKCLKIEERESKKIIPNAIPTPRLSTKENLRQQLGIDEDEIVFGRIGRPDNFTPISLAAYREFIKYCKIKSKYVIIGACQAAKDYISSNHLSDNVILIECTNDDDYIEKFNNTIDVFAHYRSDGEICSTAIAQAMMHGKPVITHFAGQNGQVENIGNGGFCVNSVDDYHKCMHYLSNKDNLKILSDNAKKFAMENYEQNFVVRAIKNFYNEIIEQKGIFNEKDNRF